LAFFRNLLTKIRKRRLSIDSFSIQGKFVWRNVTNFNLKVKGKSKYGNVRDMAT
jgi:hypothetical protein